MAPSSFRTAPRCASSNDFAPGTGRHVQIAIRARRSTRGAHLRDEIREHLRLREAGVLSEQDYEASKRRILARHA